MPDTWHCECGYTNLGSKTCLVCRRPRQALPPPRPEPVDDVPVEELDMPADETDEVDDAPPVKKVAKRPLKARSATKKAPARKRAK